MVFWSCISLPIISPKSHRSRMSCSGGEACVADERVRTLTCSMPSRTDQRTHSNSLSEVGGLSHLYELSNTTTNLTAHRSRAKCRHSNPSLYVRPDCTTPVLHALDGSWPPRSHSTIAQNIKNLARILSLTLPSGHRRQGPLARSPRQHRRQAAPQRPEDRRCAM
jgi:hypothetical protein